MYIHTTLHKIYATCAILLNNTIFIFFACCRGESGWRSDWTSTPGAWRHAGVRFLLPGEFGWRTTGACEHDTQLH